MAEAPTCSADGRVGESRFGVMASRAQAILVDPAPGAVDYARRRLADLEMRWSRFLPRSDIARLNTAPEALVLVSQDTVTLVATMKEGWRVTGGRYDPTVLGAVIAAGYSASLDGSGRTSPMTAPIGPGAGRRSGARPPAASFHDCTVDDVSIDPCTSAVVVPRGVGLDPGGIGKGLAADLVVTELLARGTGGALVSVGGDLAAAGTPPTDAGWYVNVQHPLDPERCLTTLCLSAGGVATSSTRTRSWVTDGRRRHHAIDPVTQTCSTTDLAAATVVARAGWEAEVHATAALLCGSEHVLDYLGRHGLAGLATTLDGLTVATPGLHDADFVAGIVA